MSPGREDLRAVAAALEPGASAPPIPLDAVARRFAREPDPDGETARSTGLSAAEVRAEAVDVATEARAAQARLGQASAECAPASEATTSRATASGAAATPRREPSADPHNRRHAASGGARRVLLVDDPRERLGATLAGVARWIDAGAAVTWITRPVHAARAHAAREAWLAEGLPSGRLAMVEDDGRDALRRSLALGVYDACDVAAAPDEVDGWHREAERAAPAGFGAGVLTGPELDLHLRPLVDRLAEVGPDDDPEAAAHEIAWAAFGRTGARGGACAGSVGRVVVAPRVLSAFTTALLEALEQAEDPALAPLDPWSRRSVAALATARDRGLDQGATLIHQGREGIHEAQAGRSSGSDPRVAPGGAPEGFRGPRGDATLTRLVFTNVEPRMPLAGPRGPVPCLAVLRPSSPDGAPSGGAPGGSR